MSVAIQVGRSRRHQHDKQCRRDTDVKACMFGHLSVCNWLFEVGAAGDITKDRRYGSIYAQGMLEQSTSGLPACIQWSPEYTRGPAATGGNDAHVDQAVVERDTEIPVYLQNIRPALLAWASNVVAVHDKFFTLCSAPVSSCRLPINESFPTGAVICRGCLVSSERQVPC